MPNTESLVFDLLVRDRASGGLSDIGKAADGASRNTDALTSRLNELSRKSVEARVRLAGDKDAIAALDKMDARLISLDRRVASPNLKVDGAARAIAEISAVDLEMDKLGGKGGTAEAATASLGAGGLSGPSGMGAAIAAGVALSPVIATVGTGVAGLGVAAYGTIAPIMKAAAATGGLAANLATLNPEQQLMARQLLALQGEAAGFAKSLQPEVVKLWGDALGIAGDVLHAVQPVARATGDALHAVLGDVNAELHTQQWRDFFNFMAANAGPDVKLLGQNLVDLVHVLPPLLENLQPVATELLQVTDGALKLVDATEKLQGATVHLGDTSQHSSAFMTILGNAVKNAATEMLPGLKALPLLKTGLDHVTSSSGGSAAGIHAAAAAVKAAAPAVGTLSGDIAILATTTSNSDLALKAFSDTWDIFVGRNVSDQQAVLNVTQAFESYAAAVKQGGRASTTAQLAFLSVFTTIGTGLDALHKNGASVQQLNAYYQTQIARLQALHGLTPAQRADVQGLTRDYLTWANAVTGLSGNVVKASHSLRDDFLVTMSATHRLVPAARQDADNFAAAVYRTGANSRATKHDRDVLVADLVRSGLSAQDAKARVKDFQDKIDALHGKTVPIDATASGSGGISVTAPGLAARIFKLSHLATGGLLPGFGGGDILPALLEPGETVVDKHTSRRLAPVFKAAGVPGYAAGGIAGMPPFLVGQEGSVVGGWAGSSVQSMMNSMIAAYQAAAAAAAAKAGFASGPPATGSAAAAQAFARSILPAGWSWPALLSLWNQESGWNAWAVNPSSGAYGIPQSLGHGHPYNLGDYANQVRWGISYIAGRYGSSQAAWAHEQAFNWYDQGGYLPPGLSLAYNGTGKPEPVGPAAGGNTYVINVHASPLASPADTGRAVVGAIQAFEKRSGKGWRS
jgi:hypothetical protein